jgi:hypothetical protein
MSTAPTPPKAATANELAAGATELLKTARKRRGRERDLAARWNRPLRRLSRLADAVRDVYAFTGSGMPDGDVGYVRWAGRFLTAGWLLDAAGLAGHLEEALDEAEVAGDEATLYAAYLYSFALARDKGRLLELLRGLRDVGVDFRAAVLGQVGEVGIKLLRRYAEQLVRELPPEARDLGTRWPHPILDALLPSGPGAAADKPKRQRGRPKDLKLARKKVRMRSDWRSGKYETRAALGKAHGVCRETASRAVKGVKNAREKGRA